MADLTKIFGGPVLPEETFRPEPPEIQLKDAMVAAGIEPPDHLQLDGKIHRFRSGTKGSGKAGDKSGWYIIYPDGIPAGRFGCWRAGVEATFRADVGRPISAAEEMANARRLAEAKQLRDEELAKQRAVAADTVAKIWSEAGLASAEHPYLRRKGIRPHGARVTGDGRLMVPLYDADGSLSSLQYIDTAGGKLYHPGAQTGGKFWMLGMLDEPGTLYIAEGFATAATICEATGRPVVIAYSASNLVPVLGSLRKLHGLTQDIVIVADNDASGVGQRYAEQACAKHGARMVVPPIPGDANDFVQSGHDLSLLLAPPAHDWLIPADDFSRQPAPIAWLIKRWLQGKALIMVHGPSGGGKTFVVLDWSLTLAASITEWNGLSVKPGAVIYLAGEGHHGLRARVAAWKHVKGIDKLNMWLSQSGCDLNTPEGYRRVVEQIRALGIEPVLIVVDTLHRFLSGDENSAQDAKTMLDACNALMQEFRCSVLLVHHTGVSEEAQHRARGSSAWRGALDIEVSIVPGKDGEPLQIIQRKSKDSELAAPIFARLESVEIPGWLDEDGEPVTSAVLAIDSDAKPAASKKEGKLAQHRKFFENAWWGTGADELRGAPYVSRETMMTYLVQQKDFTEAYAKKILKASAAGSFIADLLEANIIEAQEGGWTMADAVHASALMLRKNEG
jgi:phage/plasmid primase-like uncharacterized protein